VSAWNEPGGCSDGPGATYGWCQVCFDWAGGTLRATEEILGVHVDSATAKTTPFPDDVAARIQSALVPPGPDASRSIRVGS